MNYCRLIMMIVLGLAIGLPLSAEGADCEKSFSIDKEQRLSIDQAKLRLFSIGINFYRVKTVIRSHEGTELVVRVDESCMFGHKNPVELEAEELGGELRLAMGFRRSTAVGLVIGSLDIEILVPADWSGDLELVDLKSDTSIEDFAIESLSGNTSITELSIDGCSFGKMNLELGADTDLSIYATDAGDCRIRGGLGKVSGRGIKGALDIETVDGDISIDFSDLCGRSSLRSALGSVSAGLPAEASTRLDLSSRLSTAACDLPLEPGAEVSEKRVLGSIGAPSSANSLHISSGDGKVSVVRAGGEAQ